MHNDSEPVAEAFVIQKYGPADDRTKKTLTDYVKILFPDARPSSVSKYTEALADLVQAVKVAPTYLIAWSITGEEFDSIVYGARIARQLRDKLEKTNALELVRHAQIGITKNVYKVSLPIDLDSLLLKRRSAHSAVEIALRRYTNRYGHTSSRRVLPVSMAEALPGYADVVADMASINGLLEHHPLVHPDGRNWNTLVRKFMNGSLLEGGRLYADYQSLNEKERLSCTIDGSDLCEIDIKASYLYLLNSMIVEPLYLEVDPYQSISFVSQERSEDSRKLKRKAAKAIISSLFWQGAKPRTRFPKGSESQDGTFISFKEKHNIASQIKYADYQQDILNAFPFLTLEGIKAQGGGSTIMLKESKIIVKSMILLSKMDIPISAYPVHDSLISKENDCQTVVRTLQEVMKKEMGIVANLDITYSDGSEELIAAPIS